MPIHIYGQPCDMNAICRIAKEYGLEVIEDCSQAHGAEINEQKVGTFGTLAAFSCYPTKNLGGTGDGGVILCSSKELCEKINALRQYGWNHERESMFSGFNSRLDEMQAAILQVKLKYLERSNERRRHIASFYNKALQELPITLPHLPENELHAMHLYVIECEKRDQLIEHLRKCEVGASLHYPLPVHMHAAYSNRIYGSKDLPITEAFYRRHLTLPMYPELTDHQLNLICSSVQEWFLR